MKIHFFYDEDTLTRKGSCEGSVAATFENDTTVHIIPSLFNGRATTRASKNTAYKFQSDCVHKTIYFSLSPQFKKQFQTLFDTFHAALPHAKCIERPIQELTNSIIHTNDLKSFGALLQSLPTHEALSLLDHAKIDIMETLNRIGLQLKIDRAPRQRNLWELALICIT